MGVKFDLERIDTFGQGIRAFRIIPAAETGDTVVEHPDVAIIRTDNATQLGKSLRERQQRARQNRSEPLTP